LPSRETPYLAPAAGAIISATTLARASRQRVWLTLADVPAAVRNTRPSISDTPYLPLPSSPQLPEQRCDVAKQRRQHPATSFKRRLKPVFETRIHRTSIAVRKNRSHIEAREAID